MPKKTVFTNITPLPAQVSRAVAIAMLQNHAEMIELNPLVIEHHPIKTPRDAPKDEFLDCAWHEMTDRIQIIPGGIMNKKVTYKGCFHDLPNGLQTHIHAPMNLDIREKWTVCGSLPGEPEEPRELGLNTPRRGLYLREDGEMKCSMLTTGFVRDKLDKSHKVLVERILAKAERVQAHLNYSNLNTPVSSTRPSIPAFQPGSHMSTSTIVRRMTSPIDEQQPFQDDLPITSRMSNEPAAVSSATSNLRQDYAHETAQAPSQDHLARKPLPRRPTEEKDDAELAIVHPLLRDQYRRSRVEEAGRNDAILPAYHTLGNQQGQYYSQDLAKRPTGKQFAAELEGSVGNQQVGSPSGPRRTPDSYGRQFVSELEGSEPPSASGTSFADRGLPFSNTNGPISDYVHRLRSQSQPMVEADTYISNSSGSRTMDRYSVVSGVSDMPTPKAHQLGFDNTNTRFSVVSALTGGARTPEVQTQSFAEQQWQAQGRNMI